jgi:predicted Zn-dependent peptidase
MKEPQVHTFDNNIRFVYQQVSHTKIFHCGFTLDIGSRDEPQVWQGIAHFWEHLAFKGTNHRSSLEIINSLDSLGGELNAYTTKEKICFHASVPVSASRKAVEVLSDIVFYPTFPQAEIEKERRVILEEMSMYEEDHSDMIGDEFEELIFFGDGLQHNIMGSRDSVSRLKRSDFFDFLEQSVDNRKIVFSAVGSQPFEKVLEKVVGPCLEKLPQKKIQLLARSQPQPVSKFALTKTKDILQAHCVLGSRAYGFADSKSIPFALLVNLLGGPSMNSRLNLQMREEHGLVYSVEAQHNSYSNTGNFMIQFACEASNLQACRDIVREELQRLLDKPMSNKALKAAKTQFKGQLLMSAEANLSQMQFLAKSLLDMGRIETLPEVFEQINAIQPAAIQEIAQEIFAAENLCELIYLPE